MICWLECRWRKGGWVGGRGGFIWVGMYWGAFWDVNWRGRAGRCRNVGGEHILAGWMHTIPSCYVLVLWLELGVAFIQLGEDVLGG